LNELNARIDLILDSNIYVHALEDREHGLVFVGCGGKHAPRALRCGPTTKTTTRASSERQQQEI
jgi:hypothetical protein